MSGRARLLVPEDWCPTRGTRVEVLPHRDEPVPPAGIWRVIDRSNGEPGPHWWVQPVDVEALEWARRHPSRIVQSCLEVKGLRLIPPGYAPPRDKGKGARR